MKYFIGILFALGVSCSLGTTLLDESEIRKLVTDATQIGNLSDCFASESCASDWITTYDRSLNKLLQNLSILKFKKEAHDTNNLKGEYDAFDFNYNEFLEKTQLLAKKFLENDKEWNPVLRRMLKLASHKDISFNTKSDNENYNKLLHELKTIYSQAKVCDNQTNECLALEPDLNELFKTSRDYERLLWAWKGWNDATGKKMRHIYTKTIEIRNKAAIENGYKDLSEKWMEDFEDENFEKNYDSLFEQVRPLYDQLHAYVRRKLKDVYGSNYPHNHNPQLIPAHLLGNIWAQSWDNLYDLLAPFPEQTISEFTDFLTRDTSPNKMFQLAEKFFLSLGFQQMTEDFWKNSLIVKSKNKNGRCHPTTFDFYNEIDYRLKMCITRNVESDFFRVYKEMAEIEYFMSYRNQPTLFRQSANPAFHEALGNTVILSVQSPKYLKKNGLIENDSMNKEQEINFLMWIALKKVAFLPFGYLMDKWRWNAFRGNINESNFNQKWWEMRAQFQGVEPPVERSEEDFDAGSKFHLAYQMPYARHFVSNILEFQFYKSLCAYAEFEGPLFKCDFSNSEKAGYFLKKMLELGASKHPTFALNVLTGQTNVSVEAFYDYFKPLQEWLINENSKYSNESIGF